MQGEILSTKWHLSPSVLNQNGGGGGVVYVCYNPKLKG